MIENKRDVRLLELELNYLRELIDKLSEDEMNQRIESERDS
ncbi:hypothetical protein [Paucisalibacillus globulus]|jgi:hypothetical protein|nr:hypothetical protein [Paucisalibacillus globulus]